MKRLLAMFLLTAGVLFAQDPVTIETVIASRQLWPRQVVVNVEHQVPILVAGKVSGSMRVPPGRTYTVKSITAAGVQVDAMGTPLTIPATDTDLLSRVQPPAPVAAAPAPADQPTSAPVAQAAPAPALAAAAFAVTKNALASQLSGKLVTREGRKLESFDADKLTKKKYLAVYFSASWCPPCRTFTPELVSWYKRKKGSLDNFDIIFVSRDREKEDMEEYMRTDKMEWPAMSYEEAQSRNALSKYAGRGIPCLVLLDENGKVLSDSYEGDQYLGPTKVMKDLDKLLSDAKSAK